MPQPDAVTVVIPVGPSEANRRWLDESILSALDQAAEIVIVDDTGSERGLRPSDFGKFWLSYNWIQTETGWTIYGEGQTVRIWRAPWRLGVAHAFNVGVGLARTELVFMLGSDDTLRPRCIEACVERWKANDKRDAYYFVGVHYLDGSGDQFVPCNAAMVTKQFWRETGGFPVESASGAPDAALISMLMVHNPRALVQVSDEKTYYNYRRHADTDTAQRGPWQGVILETRNLLTGRGFV